MMIKEGVKATVRLCGPPLVGDQTNGRYPDARPHLVHSVD